MEASSTIPSRELKCSTLLVPKFKADPYEENGSETILSCEDGKLVDVIDLQLKYNGKESCSDYGFIEFPLIERMGDKKEDLDTKIIDKDFDGITEPCTIKNETKSVDEVYYGHEGPFKSEFIEQEEVQIKHEENKEDRLNEKKSNISSNTDKEFHNETIIVMGFGIIKKETNNKNATSEEIYSENPFHSETGQQREVRIKNEEKKKLNKKSRKPGNQSVLHQCAECPFRTNRKHSLKTHSIKHKNPDELDWYSCLVCPYKTPRKGNLKTHTDTHNNLMLKCLKCSYETLRPKKLKEHQIEHKINFQWLHCAECSFKTHQRYRLQNHLLAHKSGSFKCSNCPYQARRKDQLIAHQVKHDSTLRREPFKCPNCPYEARRQSELNMHQLKHQSIDKWHSCLVCPYKTYNKDTLRKHCLRQHSTDPKYNSKQIEIFKCTECLYRTGCKDNLKKHQLNHDQNSWLRCPDCEYKTPHKSNLQKHQVRHQGENAEGWHRCLKCPYKTAYPFNLRKHVESHESTDEIRPFRCSQCSFKSPYEDSLGRHELKHTQAQETEWFFCYKCAFKTKYKAYLPKHMSKHKKQIDMDYFQNSGK